MSDDIESELTPTFRRKKEARSVHERSRHAQKLRGIKAKLYNKKRHAEKIQMKKTQVIPPIHAVIPD